MVFDANSWGSVADWIVAATAVAAVWIGRQQLVRVVEESARQADVARADLMLKIDQIFEVDLLASRKAIQTLRNQSELAAAAEDPEADESAQKRRSADIFSKCVNELYTAYKAVTEAVPARVPAISDRVANQGSALDASSDVGSRYHTLMALPYWMETVGMLARKNLIKREDVFDLYDAAFIGVLTCFDAHITFRRNERLEKDNRFLEYATWFRDEAKQRSDRMAAAPTNRSLYQIPSLFRTTVS